MATHIDSKTQETIHARTDAAAQAAHRLVDRVAQRAEVSEEKLRASADEAQRKLRSSLANARTRSVEAKASATGFLRRHPLASLGIAFGIGALLAARSSARAAATAERIGRDDSAIH
jgi:ElaB/YqjD/DUF883 family membrane-anchored ribosome-binding protein